MSKDVNFSQRVINLRKAMGLNQEAFANLIGLSRNYVSMIEGGREPSKQVIKMIGALEEKHRHGDAHGVRQKPCDIMRRAREAKGLSFADLAKLTRYNAGVLAAVEGGTGQASERMIDAIAKALGIDPQTLLDGSDHEVVREPTFGTYGATPPIEVEPGVGKPRYLPLLSMAQAGTMTGTNFTDDSYQREGVIMFGAKDSKAFGVTIRGDSMTPKWSEGDVAIVYPSHTPRQGDTVICRLTESAGGDVMFKLFSARDSGRRVVLTSYNPAYPPLEFSSEDFVWIYPVAAMVSTLLRR